MVKEVINKKGAISLGIFLSILLDLDHSQSIFGYYHNIDWTDIVQVGNHVCKGEVRHLSGLLTKFMGSGPGLTPSADDFIIGLLLSLNRWQNLLWTSNTLRDLYLSIVASSYQRTTLLSANLIECATLGLAGERLIDALDWIASGNSKKRKKFSHLLDWCSSSGVDAFVGMAVALS